MYCKNFMYIITVLELPSPLAHSSLSLTLPSLSSSFSSSLSSPLLRPLWFLRLVLPLMALLPCPAQGTRFRVGVVGPWGCDPLFSKAMPGVAAQLAVDRINKDPALSWEDTFDYVLLQEPCQTARGLQSFLGFQSQASAFIGLANPVYCDAASMLSKGWNKAMFSWWCEGHRLEDVQSHPSFSRSTPRPSRVLLSLLRYFRWAHVGIISSPEPVWAETANMVADSLRSYGVVVRLVDVVENSPQSARKTLAKFHKLGHMQMVVLCMHSVLLGGQTQRLLLETAYDMRMSDGGLAFVPYDALLFSLPHRNVSYDALRTNGKLRRAYDAVLTVTVESAAAGDFYEAYGAAVASGEVGKAWKPQQVSPLFGTIYNSVLLMAYALRSLRDSGDWLSGGNLARHTQNLELEGFSHPIRTNGSSTALLNFVVLDTDGLSWELRPTHRVELEGNMVHFLGRDIHFPNAYGPSQDAACWFNKGPLCSAGVNLILAVSIFLGVMVTIFLLMALLYCVRRRIIQIRLVRGPNRIRLTLADVTFISASLCNKMLSMSDSRTSEAKLSVNEHSVRSNVSEQSPATHENSNVAIYEGDWVWLKKLPSGAFKGLDPNTSIVFELIQDLRHENINPFMGFFQDCGVFAMVTEFCSRGSLEDLLLNEEVKLDWMFKSSLLLDLIKGMKYLHNRGVCHGRLKSRNCVVDGRFVLKITDCGYNEVLEAQRFSPPGPPPPEDLLWTAPEVLRGGHPGLHGNKHADVYSFGIIMQEVVIRGPPYCMLDLTATEILERVTKPPPICRPVVSPDYAPAECIHLMKLCWSEQPDRRPAFDEIFNQFKDIHKGRKTNIIDSMLRMLEQYSSNLEELIRERTEELEIEKQKTEKLLTQMLPKSVAQALKMGTTVEPEDFESVSLYFSDVVGFTTISAHSEPIEVVDLLNDLYTLFDAIIGNHDVYKVETIGDAYMVASGVPILNGDRHAAEIANMALDILSAVGTFKMRHMPDVPLRLRIGLHTGPCVAGVVGLSMPRYCLFGDTVTTASRMESSGMPQRIHVHQSTVKILLDLRLGYKFTLRGRTEVKGKAEETYWLVGREGFDKPMPIPPEFKPG
uniref:Guanylate cyclase n=1 Tax=Gadus morhua TaxID=8049 RepID=A0A8C4ZLE5_GADMO